MNETDMNTAIYETEAEAVRERIASTVDDLQTRLSPRTVMSNTLGSLQSRSADVAGDVVNFLRDHPLAIGGAALAVGLLLVNRDRLGGYAPEYDAYADVYGDDGYDPEADEESSMMSRVRDRAATARSTLSERAGTLREGASERLSSARERAGDYAGTVRARAADARMAAAERFDTNPLGGALIGFAIGAIAGALLPRSRRENELLGEARDRLAERARVAAQAAVDAGRQQLDEMGVNAEAAKSKLADIGQQAADVAKTAGQAAAAELKPAAPPTAGPTPAL